MRLILKIYDYLAGHSKMLWTSLALLTAMFIGLVACLRYSEDISDFLPLGTDEQEQLAVYQNISGASRLYILFSNPDDADMTVEAISCFEDKLRQKDSLGWCSGLTTQFDMGRIREVSDFVYANIPYFLEEEDYVRMDSLLSQPDYVTKQMQRNMEMLMFPTGGMMASNLSRDPLGLFNPVLGELQSSSGQMIFEMYDGYVFTPDMSRAIAMLDSPFGNSETEYNTRMLSIIHESIDEMEDEFPEVQAHVVGGPEIAVGNASRIKKDSVLAISLSAVLIIALVVFSIGSVRNILLIFLSIGWGWLFALGGMSLFSSNVSIIVIGISSVILGIAVNYPLHLIVHLSHVPDIRQAIKEIMLPLVIGNITTVGAFLTLVPLQSAALRDLGLFASLLLVGTILFVLIYLPHMLEVRKTNERRSRLIEKLSEFSPENSKLILLATVIVTIVLSVFSFRTDFDSNMANINYMTDRQREDMQYFQNLFSQSGSTTTQSVYVMSSGQDFEEALLADSKAVPVIDSLVKAGLVDSYKGVSRFLVSQSEQQERLDRWNRFVADHSEILSEQLKTESLRYGFSPSAFDEFNEMLERSSGMNPQVTSYFKPLTQFILSQNLTSLDETGKSYVINVLNVEKENMKIVKSCFDDCFDVVSMNSSMSENLSDNFNYIGLACSLIVFIFLWFSFGRIELAAISFLPMAVSWIWILGIMSIAGISFNIVNVILATFIFGQGDDYTIFMTEGCQHEYTYRRPILASYKSSIIQSALIMFVGIGTLIVSRHPAMKSLGEVTIVGMLSVVLMAYMLPPLLFKWLTTKDGKTRIHPITLSTLFRGIPEDPVSLVRGRYIYKGQKIMKTVSSNLRDSQKALSIIPDDTTNSCQITDHGYGETAILFALTHPEVKVTAYMDDEDKARIAEISAKDFIDNIEFKLES